jgi:hypothetical protein
MVGFKPMNINEINKKDKGFLSVLLTPFKEAFFAFDKKVDGSISFFVKHYGKSRFMIAMSKKAQYLGLEKLWHKGPKAFVYFFLFYLVRDTILYIILPIFFARIATN